MVYRDFLNFFCSVYFAAKSSFSCINQLKVVNDSYGLKGNIPYTDLFPQGNIFRHDNGMQVDIIPSRKLNRYDVYGRLGC